MSQRYRLPGGLQVESPRVLMLPHAEQQRGVNARSLRLDDDPPPLPPRPPVHDADDVPPLKVYRDPQSGAIDIDHDGWWIHSSPSSLDLRVSEVRRAHQFPLALVLEYVWAPLRAMFEDGFVGLHASAVAIDGHAVALLGPSGVGKSTTAYVLTQRHGARLLSDDLALISPDTPARLSPSCSTVRLWRPQLNGARSRVSLGGSREGKNLFLLPEDSTSPHCAPLAAVVQLDVDRSAPTRGLLHAPRLGHERAAALLAQCFDLSHPPAAWSAWRFKRVCEIARGVPQLRFRYAHSDSGKPEHVAALFNALTDHLSSTP